MVTISDVVSVETILVWNKLFLDILTLESDDRINEFVVLESIVKIVKVQKEILIFLILL
jgi:hypothetical protein